MQIAIHRRFLLAAAAAAVWAGCPSTKPDPATKGDPAAKHALVGPLKLDAAECDGPGCTSPAPVFQRGNSLMEPLADSNPGVKSFLDFYGARIGQMIPPIAKSDVPALPPRYIDIADNGQKPEAGKFNSSLVCQTCHDSDWTKRETDLANMNYWAQGMVGKLAANWSLFGDWSGSIKALAGRDPVFLEQVETARNNNPGLAGTTIDNLCFRCHSAMAQRQANADGVQFSHYMLYSTPPGTEYQNPFSDQPLTAPQYATYGALGRDGISCSVCHTIGPASGQPWNGTDYDMFYGAQKGSVFGDDVTGRLINPDNVDLPPYPFTAHMETHPGKVNGPDSALEATPMGSVGLTLSRAETASAQPGPLNSYMQTAPMCGTCHVVILPAVPAGYAKGAPIPGPQQAPKYKRPSTCPSSQKTWTGDPVTDPCVPLGYEQLTYFEWLNSGYPTSADNCLNCHMPTTRQQETSDNPGSRVRIAQVNSDLEQFYQGDDDLRYRDYNRHTLVGINMFVLQMYQQFSDILGTQFYRQPKSVVPPYYQHINSGKAVNSIPNPGAEDGTQGWTVGVDSKLTAVTQAKSGNLTITPHSGKYFFDAIESSLYEIDVASHADVIDQGKAKIHWGGYVYTSEARGFIYMFGVDESSNILAPDPEFLQADDSNHKWQYLEAESTVPPGTRTMTMRMWSASNTGKDTYFDDLFVELKLPTGSGPIDADRSYEIANNLLNAEQSIVDLAFTRSSGNFDPNTPAVQVAITDAKVEASQLTVTVTVTNNVGHKFPSGAPFRRAFLQLEVLDGEKVLFASGVPNSVGAICKGACDDPYNDFLPSEFPSTPADLQPHYQVITSEDQVQIYEDKAVDEKGNITTRALSIFEDVKDNRLLPLGWLPPAQRQQFNQQLHGLDLLQLARLTAPASNLGDAAKDNALTSDPDYSDPARIGTDTLTYQISLPKDAAPKTVRVRMNYQSIPPSYLAGRFKDGFLTGSLSPAVKRVIYMTSRLNLDLGLKSHDGQDVMNGWSMVLAEAEKPIN
jgi:hypothetical protein